MTAHERPWWASDPRRAAGDVDPLEAHRAARRGREPDHPGEAEPGAATGSRSRHGADPDAGSTWIRLARGLDLDPAVADHLDEAGRHLAAAFRALTGHAVERRHDGGRG